MGSLTSYYNRAQYINFFSHQGHFKHLHCNTGKEGKKIHAYNKLNKTMGLILQVLKKKPRMCTFTNQMKSKIIQRR